MTHAFRRGAVVSSLVWLSLSCGGGQTRPPDAEVEPDVDAAASPGRGGAGGGAADMARADVGGGGGSPSDASVLAPDVGSGVGPDVSSVPADAGGDASASTWATRHCPPNVPGGNPLPPAGMRNARRVQFDPAFNTGFTEGALWLADPGVLLFSDFTGPGRIVQLVPPATASVFIPGSGTNGLALSADGRSLIVADQVAGAIVRYSLPDKTRTAITNRANGQTFKPNDLVVRADGTIYFSDLDAGRVYRLPPGGQASLVAMGGANGVILSPDETSLYVNGGGRLRKFVVNPNGTLGDDMTFAMNIQGPDGMAVDCAGNVYAAQYGGGSVAVFSPTGQRWGEITVANGTTNAAFGGPDRKRLYITAGNNGVFAIDLMVPGLPY